MKLMLLAGALYVASCLGLVGWMVIVTQTPSCGTIPLPVMTATKGL